MADKQTKLSIVVRTVDQATARIKAINDRLDAITKPMKDFRSALSDLRSKSGLDGVISGFKGVASGIVDVLGKMAMIGGVAGGAVAALFHIVDGYDELGDKAEEAGVSVDFLAQMRYAAERSGAAVETLDSGLNAFSKSLGQVRAGTGRMNAFLNKVNPAFLKQLKGAKSNEEAFGFLAEAMGKLEDPAKRAALAAATVGDPALAPLLHKGAEGIKALRDEHFQLAGSQQEAAEKSGEVDDALKKMKASTDGIKAALITGLAPALTVIVNKLKDWFVAHREDVKQWAHDIGEKLPGAIEKVVKWVGMAFDKVSAFVDKIGGLKTVAYAVGVALVAGPVAAIANLIGSVGKLIGNLGKLSSAFTSAAGAGSKLGGLSTMGALGIAGGAAALAPAVGEQIADAFGQKDGLVSDMFQQLGSGKVKSADDLSQRIGQLDQQRGAAAIADFTGQARQILDAARSTPNKTEIEVKIGNAPPGTSVKTKSTGDVDMRTGATP